VPSGLTRGRATGLLRAPATARPVPADPASCGGTTAHPRAARASPTERNSVAVSADMLTASRLALAHAAHAVHLTGNPRP
jgi:hypothetical protein